MAPPALDHTIVWATDKARSARFLADVLGLPVGAPSGPFLPVELGNGVTLDYASRPAGPLTSQHYAFRIDETAFDAAFARVVEAGIEYWADPGHSRPGEINHWNGGRGFYFDDPDGHMMELLTAGS
jgi:catechol 2,3-dioxygenase-like lactoylglutathione lyase family enzyme